MAAVYRNFRRTRRFDLWPMSFPEMAFTSSRSNDADDGHHFKTNTANPNVPTQSSLIKERKTMNSLTQFKKLLMLPLLIALPLVFIGAPNAFGVIPAPDGGY